MKRLSSFGIPEPFTTDYNQHKLLTNASWQIDVPLALESTWIKEWKNATIVLAPYSNITFTISFTVGNIESSIDFIETLGRAISTSNFWQEVDIEPVLMIPSQSNTRLQGTLYSQNLYSNSYVQFTSASSEFHNLQNIEDIMIARLYNLSIAFEYSLIESESTANIDDLLKLTDTALRILIVDKLSRRIPMIFCPGYAKTITSRMQLVNSVIAPSISRILDRRRTRVTVSQSAGTFLTQDQIPATIEAQFWKVLTSSLQETNVDRMKLVNYKVLIHSTVILTFAEQNQFLNFDCSVSTNQMLSDVSEHQTANANSEDLILLNTSSTAV
ncbi:hypothetical protein V1512DRAFT_253055 [Lipomyces arxii]|uniref:uncharacterized protein n=1 Tax=Lipomyces arxii TaxID=56418 RepID=UPI0034CE537B